MAQSQRIMIESDNPEWHASKVAELYIPKFFENKKSSGGYWF